VEAFFVSYNQQRGKKFKVRENGRASKRLEILKGRAKRFEAKEPGSY